MKSIYKNIKDYAFTEHIDAFKILIEVFNSFSIQHFLIGAQARDVHFLQRGIKPIRGTRDIDFAVMVEDGKQYMKLIDALKDLGFEKTKDPYRLIWQFGSTVIDLLPFGEIEENYTVNFDKRNVELSVLGYRELNDELQSYYIDADKSVSIPVPPLHGVFILKLLSWDDKKLDREKDLKDLYQILIHYWSFAEEEAYENHLDLFDDENFTTEMAAARILGRHIKITLEKSKVLSNRVIQIIKEQASLIEPPGLMLQKFSSEKDKSIEEVKLLLDEILKGINERS